MPRGPERLLLRRQRKVNENIRPISFLSTPVRYVAAAVLAPKKSYIIPLKQYVITKLYDLPKEILTANAISSYLGYWQIEMLGYLPEPILRFFSADHPKSITYQGISGGFHFSKVKQQVPYGASLRTWVITSCKGTQEKAHAGEVSGETEARTLANRFSPASAACSTAIDCFAANCIWTNSFSMASL